MPTIRQKKAIANLVENRGNVSKAMRDAGYDLTTAKNPKNLTESVAFKEYADALPDDLLIQVHLEGLQATKRSGTGGMLLNLEKSEFGHTDLDEPDYATRHKYLDSAYKIKGTYSPEKSITLNLRPKPTDRVKKIANELRQIQRRGNSSSN